MELTKIQYISFTSADDAIKVAKFLIVLGFKINKKYLNLETYLYNNLPYPFSPVFPGSKRGDLKYSGFIKYGNKWELTNNNGDMFTFKTKAIHFIRLEKLKRLNNL